VQARTFRKYACCVLMVNLALISE